MQSPTIPQLTRPRMLKPGDTIGIAAPASPFDRKTFDAGLGILDAMGFKLHLPQTLYSKNGYLAGSDAQRAEQLMALFADPEIDGIICARGGYGSMRILSLLDAKVLAKHPKVFVGFSDITALLAFLVQRSHMVAFHGPTVTTLGAGDPVTRDDLLAALTTPEAITLEATDDGALRPGVASGPFFCANLTVLCHLTGTAFQPDLSGCILLIEDRGEAPYRIDRMLTQMRLAGCFDNLAGLALGQFTDCGSQEEIGRIVDYCLAGLDLPILGGFDVGHGAINRTLPVGLTARLDADNGTLAFDTAGVI